MHPERWSEHLAFVRAGDVEIGHLAAPPRTRETIEGAVRNLERARAVVGSLPLCENIATLIDPPGSTCDEATWLTAVLEQSGAPLLLDLHNLHANARNFGYDPLALIARLDLSRLGAVHIAGGRLIPAHGREHEGEMRILDDHLHDVPDPVYELLTEVAARAPGPLTVILERDGRYPPMAELLAQLDAARAALERGRIRQADPQGWRF